MRTFIIFATVVLLMLGHGTRAEAASWCARYDEGHGTNCGFDSFKECEADIFGLSGSYCTPNLASPGSPDRNGAHPSR